MLLEPQSSKFVLIWTSLALSPNTIQMAFVAFKVRPYPTSVSVFSISYQPWFALRLVTQLDRVSCDQSSGIKASVQTRQSPKILKVLWWSGGMHQWQQIFMAVKAVTTSLERQTICFSERGLWYWCAVYKTHNCEISARRSIQLLGGCLKS